MLSSSPMRTPKLQLTAEQSTTGEWWIISKKDTPRPRAKKKTQQDSRRGKTAFRLKPHAHQRLPDGSRGGTGQQWPAAGPGVLGAADLGMA